MEKFIMDIIRYNDLYKDRMNIFNSYLLFTIFVVLLSLFVSMNITYKKWWDLKTTQLSFTFEITNLLNTLNTAIVNPVTGEAYQYGDPVPSEWRDPSFIDPRDPRSYGTPPDNPARYYEQRHILAGLSWKF